MREHTRQFQKLSFLALPHRNGLFCLYLPELVENIGPVAQAVRARP